MFNEAAYALGANRSCIRDLYEYGRTRATIVGEDNICDFSLGNPSVAPPDQVTQVLRELIEQEDPVALHGYTSAIGDRETRAAISADLNRRFGADSSPEDFFIGTGAAAELCAVFSALSRPEGEILAIAPYFPEYKPFAEHAGLRFKVVPADIPAFQIDLKALEGLLNFNTQALILNSPNNPSGTVYTRETLTALAALLSRKEQEYHHPIYIVSDEPYRELTYGAEVPFVPSIYRNTVLCYSYSKVLSLPGERIGYVYIPRQASDCRALYAAIAGSSRVAGHVCAPSLWQKVIAKCADLQPDLTIYNQNRTLLYENLTRMGYQVAKPDGAFYLFVKAPSGRSKIFSERAKERDLLVVPGNDFGCPGYFRICYCVKTCHSCDFGLYARLPGTRSS